MPASEKGENDQESTHLLRVYCPKRRSFYPVPPAAPVGRFFARRQLRRALYLAFLAVSRLSRSLSPAGNLLSNHSHTTAFLSFRCPFRYVVPSSAMMAHSAGDCPLSEHKKQWFFVSAWSITLSAGAERLPAGRTADGSSTFAAGPPTPCCIQLGISVSNSTSNTGQLSSLTLDPNSSSPSLINPAYCVCSTLSVSLSACLCASLVPMYPNSHRIC